MATPSTLTRAQSLWALAALARPDRVDYLSDLADRHPEGAVIRAPGRRFLVTADACAAKRVLVENGGNYRKGLGQSQARTLIGDGLLTAEGATWRAQRDAATPYLRSRALQPHIPALCAHAHRSIDALLDRLDDWTHLDLSIPLADFTLSCLAEVFGLRPPDAHKIHDAFDAIQDEAILSSITQGRLPLKWRRRSAERVEAALATLREQARFSLGDATREDAWATFEGMCSLFLAGYETTSSTLAWSLHNLAGRAALQGALACEGTTLSAKVRPQIEDTLDLDWSRAVLKETLRLRPPVWLISREALGADVVCGLDIRPGDEVLILPAAAQRQAWAQPREFDPARFGDKDQSGPTMWFGSGSRACPGGTLALLEGSIWLAVAMSKLELRIIPGIPVTALARMSQIPAPGTFIQARRRSTRDRPQPSPSPAHAAAGGVVA